MTLDPGPSAPLLVSALGGPIPPTEITELVSETAAFYPPLNPQWAPTVAPLKMLASYTDAFFWVILGMKMGRQVNTVTPILPPPCVCMSLLTISKSFWYLHLMSCKILTFQSGQQANRPPPVIQG